MTTTHQRARPYVYLWTGEANSERIDLSDDVVSMQVSKPLDAPAGSWTIQLMPRQGTALSSLADVRRFAHLYRLIQPNHVVSLGFEEPGGIMLGLVDSVDKSRDLSGPQVAQSLTIRGRDLGKLLVQDDLIHASVTVDTYAEFRKKITEGLGADHPILVDLLGIWGPQGRDGTPAFEGKGVKEVVDFILDHAGSIELPALAAATGGTGKASDSIGTAGSITTWDDDRIYSDRPLFYQGSLWGFLWSVLDRDFYEARLDCRPKSHTTSGVPFVELIIRPKPFDEQEAQFVKVKELTGIGWDDLRTLVTDERYHTIPEDELLAESLGVTDADAASYYLITSEHDLIGNPSSMAEGLFYPLVDTFSAKRFGMRTLQSQLSLVSGDFASKVSAAGTEDTGEVTEAVRDKRGRLFNWNRTNPWYENGSIRVSGHDYYRPGDRVYLPWSLPKIVPSGHIEPGDGLHFYVAGVSWDWSFGGMFGVSLSLQRGHNSAVLAAIKERIRDDAPASNPDHFASS